MARIAGRTKVVSSKVMFKGRVFGVRRDQVVEPDGTKAIREIVTHPGSVVVLPVFSDGRILMIRQFRYAAGDYLWELVAGHKEPGETFKYGAGRELREETGYSARRYRKLLDVFPTPGFVSERMVIFLAEGLTKGEAHPEEDENIETRILTLKEVERWIQSGKIRDAKSVAGLLYYARFVKRNR